MPLKTFGKFTRICSRVISPTTVTSSRPSSSDGAGRDVHPAAVRRPVADRDQPRLDLVRVAVDGEPERVRLVDGQRAQHRRDVQRGAREAVHGVRPPVRLGVEARRGDARVPAAVDAAEVDDPVVTVLERVERVRADAWCRSRARVRSRCRRRSERRRDAGRYRPRRPRPRPTSPSPPHATRSCPIVGRFASERFRSVGVQRDRDLGADRGRGALDLRGAACASARARPPD